MMHKLISQFKRITVVIAIIAITTLQACKAVKAPTLSIATYPSADGYAQDPLPYSYSALEPYIDGQTMKAHFTQYHTAYLKKLNDVKFAHESMMGKSLEELLQNVSSLPNDVQQIVRDNGGGHWNHAFYWQIMAPAKGQQPKGALAEAIVKKWGSIEDFKTEFESKGNTHTGDGWVWLVKTAKGLAITTTSGNDNPLMDVVKVKGIPLLTADLWEHAYTPGSPIGRADYLKNFWSVVNWEQANELFLK